MMRSPPAASCRSAEPPGPDSELSGLPEMLGTFTSRYTPTILHFKRVILGLLCYYF